MYSTEAVRNTEILLLTISRRLAGREECRGVNYEVTISKGQITMVPEIEIFPNRYSKKESDKVSVLSYVMMLMGSRTDELVHGTYIYKSSIDRKKRQWFRERSNLDEDQISADTRNAQSSVNEVHF